MGLMAQFVDKVAVMYAGRLVEVSDGARDVHRSQASLRAGADQRACPSLDNKGVFQGIPGLAPSLLRLPSGCAFHPRCPYVTDAQPNDAPGARNCCRADAS